MPNIDRKVDRTEKLVSLAYTLTTTRIGYTRAQLRDMVDDYAGLSDEAFERKFERDKETLRNLGIVIVDGKGRSDASWDAGDPERRYRVLPSDYRLPPLDFDPLEAAVLGSAARVVAGGGLGRQAARAAERLGVDSAAHTPVFASIIDTEAEHLEPLVRHLAMGNPVRFTYSTADGRTESRAVMPWGLGHRHGHWYLAAGDTKRDGDRLFRLDRIVGKVVQHAPKAEDHVADAYGRPDRFRMSEALDRLERGTPTSIARVLLKDGRGGTLGARALSRTHTEAGTELELAYRYVGDLAAEVAAEGLDVLAPRELAQAVVDVLRGALAAQEAEAPTYKLTGHRGGRAAAETTVSRALDLVAFVVGQGAPTPAEVMARFGLSRDELEAELTRLLNCGVPNGLHDELLEVEWDDTSVRISNAEVLAKPINLNLGEAASLLIGLDAMASAPEGSYTPEAQAAIGAVGAKLRGLRPELQDFDHVLAVHAAAENSPWVGSLTRAIEERRVVELDYAGGTAEATRLVEPIRLLDVNSRTYLQAWCRTRQAPRTFRLDRIVEATVLEERFAADEERAQAVRSTEFTPTDARLEAHVAWRGAWVEAAAAHTPERSAKLPDGVVTQLKVVSPEYLVRLVVASAGAVTVVHPPQVREATTRAIAARLEAAEAALAGAAAGDGAAAEVGAAEEAAQTPDAAGTAGEGES